jgi:hypothetical protein
VSETRRRAAQVSEVGADTGAYPIAGAQETEAAATGLDEPATRLETVAATYRT